MAAYPQSQPPWYTYYDETTKGMLNKPLASELRRYRPEPLNNYLGNRDQVSRLLQARQADYLSGHLKDSEMVGIEIDVLMNPGDYKVSNSMVAKESVYSLDQNLEGHYICSG